MSPGFWAFFFIAGTLVFHNKRYLAATGDGGGDDSTGGEAPEDATALDVEGLAGNPMTITGDASDVELPPKSTLAFEPALLAWDNLSYSVDIKDDNGKADTLELLHGISAFAEPGTTTALMGSSGAGKTTLLDVLAGTLGFR